MNKEVKKLSPLELWKNFLLFVEAPAKARLLDCEWKDGLEQYNFFKSEIENALKNYEELTNKPVMFYRSTHGSKQALIDMICKNHKEVKITCLEDEKKLKALNEILTLHDKWLGNEMSDFEFFTLLSETRDKYDLLKEVLL